VLRARLVAGPELAALEGRQLVAFAGIGRPSKFFDMLTQAGMAVVGTYGFADHQLYTGHRLARLQAVAARAGALLVTTPKDFARIPASARGMIVPVSVALAWEDEAVLTGLLACVLAGSGRA
jgi:tetraacyldisaccharide 4'-kinase